MSRASSRTARSIKAAPEKVYAAFMDPDSLLAWLPPDEMTGKIHSFAARKDGGYEMSLFYPETEHQFHGKTAEKEDRVKVRFIDLVPGRRIVEAVTFVSDDPALAGEMRIEITFEPAPEGTAVTFHCTNLPPGLRPEDNDEGTRMSLDQLARFVE